MRGVQHIGEVSAAGWRATKAGCRAQRGGACGRSECGRSNEDDGTWSSRLVEDGDGLHVELKGPTGETQLPHTAGRESIVALRPREVGVELGDRLDDWSGAGETKADWRRRRGWR
jgi:hypothetical protein